MQLNKLQSAQLGSNVTGQVVMDCIINPPKEGEQSYELFMKVCLFTMFQMKNNGSALPSRQNPVESQQNNIRARSWDIALMLFF